MSLRKLVSGGQTGADRAGLDAGLFLGIAIEGWCPQGRRAEDGPIDLKYPLKETKARGYQVRTEWNVRDTDGTLLLVWQKVIPRGGTELTSKFAKKHNKPCHVVDVSVPPSKTSLQETRKWICDNNIAELNIAGPRESDKSPVYEPSLEYLKVLLS